METAVFEMVNPELTESTCTADGVTRRYVRYEMQPFISRAIGKGCVCRTLGVLEGSPAPVSVCLRYSPGGEWICVWDGVADAAEAQRIAQTYVRREVR